MFKIKICHPFWSKLNSADELKTEDQKKELEETKKQNLHDARAVRFLVIKIHFCNRQNMFQISNWMIFYA